MRTTGEVTISIENIESDQALRSSPDSSYLVHYLQPESRSRQIGETPSQARFLVKFATYQVREAMKRECLSLYGLPFGSCV